MAGVIEWLGSKLEQLGDAQAEQARGVLRDIEQFAAQRRSRDST